MRCRTLPRRSGFVSKARVNYWPESHMTVSFTAVYRPVPEGFVAFVEELPGANAQGATLEEARRNLEEAVSLVLEANRCLSEEELGSADVIREPLRLTA
jgi:predicted RNase H-like HicB family nuclease